MKQYSKIILATVLFYPVLAFSASDVPAVYLRSSGTEFAPGSEFSVNLLVTSSAQLNALSLVVRYPSDKLQLLNIGTAGSVINFWKEEPGLAGDGLIAFEGGASAPFSGDDLLIARLDFRALAAGTAPLGLVKTDFYYADGKGTLVQASVPRRIFPSNHPRKKNRCLRTNMPEIRFLRMPE